jgi:very-short-patch-repair endonuclease
MTEALQTQILEALQAKPNQKADELARKLGSSRSTVNKLLYGPLKGQVSQDRGYRWSYTTPPQGKNIAGQDGQEEQFANTDLARLCRYYLACLGYDDTGLSTFLTSKYGDPDYVEVKAIPNSPEDLAESEAGRKLLGRKRTERGRYGLYFGYPTSVPLLKSRRSNWEGFMVEPILLFPIEQEAGTGRLKVDLSFPIINQKPFQTFTNVERDMLMNEVVQLEQELGLGGEEGRPDIDEIAMRLQAVRPEWPWKEDIDPTALDEQRSPMGKIDEPGIYNRAVILMAEKSPFTQGLENELRALAQLPADKYSDTALGRWLVGDSESSTHVDQLAGPLIEVLPMNSEQRQAVSTALTQPVTIITGPPGTGKSQVVTNLLVNAAWSGKRVLFASKNNKAVDVVETRVNALGSRPVLLRVGAQAYQARLAEYVLALLSSKTTVTESEEFADTKAAHERFLAELSMLSEESQKFIELRNNIDRLEQIAEEARQHLGPDLFASSIDLVISEVQSSVQTVSAALEKADRTRAGFLVRLIWPLFRNRRLANLADAMSAATATFGSINTSLPAAPAHDADVPSVRQVVVRAFANLTEIEKARDYRAALFELQAARPLEEIAREEAVLLDAIARNSEMLWKLWLRLQPSMITVEERQKLGKYTSLLKMVVDAGDDGQLSRQVYAKYSAMLRETSHLLPCWAVTSLSARGRIPLEPGNFDLVVFDEASQCDIASALPLLYRAKSVVIIGDPKQLTHISGLQRGQDQALLERYELLEDFPHWAYSYQSLFGLGSTQASGDGIVSLVDHHRSHADIINFSNDEFYEERLRVATKYDDLRSPNRAEPGVRWVDVKGRVVRPASGGAINGVEADAVAATLRDLVLKKEYEGSIGVVTPFRAQANAITEAINRDDRLSAALIQHGFLADTVHKFQGDERDVMIFSPVVSSGLPGGALGFLRSNGSLFNVAITRARAQLIVVGDIAACGSCDIGYLSRFADYVASLEKQSKGAVESQLKEFGPHYPEVAQPDLVSDWERQFYTAAYKAGVRLIPQFPVEKYIVDFLMVDGDRKLVIEIDGERYHRNWTGELCRRDQIRNQRLFELGYDVLRFWVYEVRDDLDGCLRRIEGWRMRGAA